MKMFKSIVISMGTVGMLSMSSVSLADYKSDIISSCSKYQQGLDSKDINICKLYIDGFIDALLFTKEGVIKSGEFITLSSSTQSDYAKRAYSTRVSPRLPPKDNYQFCLYKGYDRKSVASLLARSIDIQQLQSKPLKAVLFTTLTEHYPCS